MHKYKVVAASITLAVFCSSAAMADPLLSLGGIELGNASSVGNPVGLPEVTSIVTSVVGGTTGGSVGLPGVAEVTTGSNTLQDTQITLLGGGGESINGGVGGVLGQTPVNLALNLPSGNGLPGLPGLPGELPTLPGLLGGPSGGNGTVGNNGTNGSNGANGGGNMNLTIMLGGNGANGNGAFTGNASSQTFANAGSSRLRLLLKILEDRDWLRMAAGNAVCLNGFGTTSVSGWLSRQDMAQLQGVVNYYKRDIATLQKMLANCRGNRTQISRNDVKRVIGIDIKNGKPVLFML